jgi:RNA polymerase sigma factor for flagellar operon FliA
MRHLEALPRSEGEQLFVSHLTEIDRVIAFVCSRHHLRRVDADDFSAHVKLKLIENDYAVLRKFEQRSSIRTYLSVVIQRLFLDFRISAWGKWRPSAKAKRLGPAAILVEQLTSRDGYSLEETYEIVTTNHRVPLTRDVFETLVKALPLRLPRRFESDAVLETCVAPTLPPDEQARGDENGAVMTRVLTALEIALRRFDAQDRLVLRMRYMDGRSVPQIATTLRLDQKTLYRRLDRLIRDLRTTMEADGVNSAAVRDLLTEEPVSIDWGGNRHGASVHEY